MPKFSAEISLGVNQSDVKNAKKGFMAIGSSVEHAGSLVKKLKADNDTATAAISQRVLEAVGSYGKLEKAVEVGSKSSIGNLKRTTDALEDLEQHIRQAQAAGSPVPPEAIDTLETLRARTAQLTEEMGRQAAMGERVGREMDDATRAAGGMGKGVNSVSDIFGIFSPKAEAAALKVGLYWGALQVVEQGANNVADAIGMVGGAFGVQKDVVGKSVDEMKSRIKSLLSMGPQMLIFAEIVKKIRGAASFGNVAGGSSSLGGKELALAEMSADFQQLEQDTATFLERMQALEAAGRLNADSIKANSGAAESLVKRYNELGRSVPIAVRGFVAEEKAVKKLKDQVKELVRMKLDYATPGEMLAASQASIEAAISVTDVAFEKAARTGILAALGKIKLETIELAFTAEDMRRATDIKNPKTLASWAAAQRAEAEDLFKKGLLTQTEYAHRTTEIWVETAMAVADAMGSMLGNLQGVLGILSSFGVKVGPMQKAVGYVQQGVQLYQQIGQMYGAYKAVGGWSGISGMFGAGGASTGTGVFAGSTATGTAGGAAGGASGGMAAAGWAAAFVAVVAVLINLAKTEGRAEVDTGLSFGGVGGLDVDSATSRYNKQGGVKRYAAQMKALQNLIDSVKSFITGIGGEIDSLMGATSNMTIGREGQGKKTNWFVKYADGLVKHFGNNAEAAWSFAMVQAIKQAPTYGLDPLVAAMIRDSAAESMEALQAQIQAAMAVANLGLSGEQAGYQQQQVSLQNLMRETLAVITGEEERARVISQVTAELARSRQAEIARLYGLPRVTDYVQRLRDAEAMLAKETEKRSRASEELARLIEREAALAAEAAAAQADRILQNQGKPDVTDSSGGGYDPTFQALMDEWGKTKDEIAALQALLQGFGDSLDLEKVRDGIKRGLLGDLYGYLEGNKKYAGAILAWKKKELELTFEQYKLEAMRLGMWDAAFEQIWKDALAAANAAAAGPRRGAGGNRQADRQGVVDALRDWDLSKLGAAQRGLADINKKWDDHAKAAHGNADLLAKIAAARREEIELLLKQLSLGLKRDVGDFLGRGGALGGALRGIDENAQGLIDRARDLMKAGKMTKDEFLRLRDTIRDAQAGQRQSMVQNAANSLFQELYGLLGMDKEAAQLKFDLTVAELHIKLEELKIAVKKYELEGKFLPGLEDLIRKVEEAGPGIFSGGAGGAVATYSATDIQTAIQQRIATALEMLRRYQGQNGTGNSAFMQELARVQQDFVQIREGLGNTLEVQTAYAAAIRDVITRFLDPVRDQLREMQYGEASVLSPLEQFQSIFAEAQAAAARFAAGDLSVVETAPQLIQQLLALAGQAMPQGGAGYRSVYEWAQAFLNQMLGLQTAPLNPQGIPTPGPAPVFPVGTATFPGTTSAQILGTLNNQGAVRPVTDAIVGARDMQIVELRAIRSAVERQANATERMERFRGVAYQVA